MKAVVAHGPMDLRVDEVQAPTLKPGKVLVEIAYGGICGSDLHYWQHGRNGTFEIKEALVLGHEVVGKILSHDAGENLGFSVGDPVAIHPAAPCPEQGDRHGTGSNLAGDSTYLGSASTTPHTQGGLAGIISVEPRQLRGLPQGLPLRLAALAEPMSIALHGIDRAAGKVAGSNCLVSGAGPIGLLAAVALKHRGASSVTITDLHPAPLEVARQLGVDAVIQLGKDPAPAPMSYDLVVEAAGVVPSLKTALEAVRKGGIVIQLGILPKGELSIPLADLGLRELTLFGSQRFDGEMDEALEILAARPELSAVVTDVYPVEEAQAAFARAADSQSSSKVLIQLN